MKPNWNPFFKSHELASILLEVVWRGHGFSSLRLNDVYCHFSCRVWHKNFQPIAYFAGFVQKYENELFWHFPLWIEIPRYFVLHIRCCFIFLDNISMQRFLLFSYFSLNWDLSWTIFNGNISDFFTFLSELRSLVVRLGKGSRQMGATASQSTKLRKIFNLCWNIWERNIWKDKNILAIGVEMHQIVQSWTIERW